MNSSLRGGRRRKHRKHSKTRRRGGNLFGVASQAAVPFGLFALSNYLGTGKKSRGRKRGTKKGMRRKTARKAYMA